MRSLAFSGSMQVLFLILGLVVGAGAVWFWARAKIDNASQWEDRLKAATGDALSQSQTSLLELAEAKLAPIKETLDKFEAQGRALETQRMKAVSEVGERLRAVAEGQEQLRSETGNLVTALRAPHVRGRWGEGQLQRVVELAGMVEY